MDAGERSKEGQIQLLVEYGSQYGQLQVNILEINNIILPAVKRLGISHVYAKSHLLNEKTKELLKNKGSVIGYFLADATKEIKRKTEEVKLTLSCHNADDEEDSNNDKSRKSKLRAALKKQRERFRLKRNSDKVKTVVNSAGDDNGRATLSFERPLHYPSVSLYQLQTQFLHITICGRNISTSKSYPIATTCIPLMIAIKQHHPTWYQLSYNPDLTTAISPQDTKQSVQDTWEIHEGNYTGRSVAWDMSDRKESQQDNWLHKRKDYSRHLQPKGSKKLVQKTNKAANKKPLAKSTQESTEQLQNTTEGIRHRGQQKRQSYHGAGYMNQNDSGVDLHHIGTRQDSIEELYFNSDDESSELESKARNHNMYTGSLRKSQKQWTSEFVICAPSSLDKKRTSHGSNLDMSSLSLHKPSMNQKTFGESIRGF